MSLARLALPAVPIRESSPTLEDEHTCGTTKSFGVHASKGHERLTMSGGDVGDSNTGSDFSLADMNALLQRQHRELTQRLDVLINWQEDFMKQFGYRPLDGNRDAERERDSLLGTDETEHTDNHHHHHEDNHHHDHHNHHPIDHHHCTGHEKQKLPNNVSMAINDYMFRVSTMEGENQKRQSQAREKSRRSLMSKNASPLRWYDAHSFYEKLQVVVRSVEFEAFYAIMILSSSLFVGVQVEYGASERTDEEPLGFEIIQTIYAFIFTVELALRLTVNGLRVFCKSGEMVWYWLDSLIVTSSVIEFMISMANMANRDKKDDSMNFSTLRIARIIRVTRLIRVFRIVRIVRFVRALRTLVQSIIYTLRSLVWAMLLLALVIYVFGILFTQATTEHILSKGYTPGDDAVLEKYWSSMAASMMTLFKSIAGGLSWTTVTDALTDISWGWTILFIVYIIFAYFAVLNVMTGVFCQSAIESAQRDQDMVVQQQLRMKERYVAQVKRLFKDIDEDSSGAITIQEFEDHLENENVKALFESLELEPSDAWTLFSLIDTGETHMIDIEEFVDGCVRLRGGAKSIDIARLSYENKWVRERLSAFMKYMEAQITLLMSSIYEIDEDQKAVSRFMSNRRSAPGVDSGSTFSRDFGYRTTASIRSWAPVNTGGGPHQSREILSTASADLAEMGSAAREDARMPRFAPIVSYRGTESSHL